VASTTITWEEFEQDLKRARKAAASGPVFITENGVNAFVLLTYKEYRRIVGDAKRMADPLAMPESAGEVERPNAT
jgi:prevent-host-death family protein